MKRSNVFRYQFLPTVPLEEVESSLCLALMAVESLHGETEVQLQASHYLDHDLRVCVVDSGSEVGANLNRIFAGFLRREFGVHAFQVKRLDAVSGPRSQGAEND